MTRPEDPLEETRAQWRELGFFYDVDEVEHVWRLVGSRSGLQRFAELLRAYSLKPHFSKVHDHDHFGPYWYLKVMTDSHAGIDENSIHGTQDDLNRLAGLVASRLRDAAPGDLLSVAKEYAPDCEYELVLEVRADGFDPSEVDSGLR